MNRGSDADSRFREVLGVDVASMRPRFMNRGSALHQHVDIGRPLASMRPRFMNRGSLASRRKEA